MPTRRELLKLLALGVAGHTLDIDRLLWVPGEKTIFLPTAPINQLTMADIVAIELRRITPKMKALFESDYTFYTIFEEATDVKGRRG